MPGEKVAKVKVGLYEAVRDGMVVNLLLEAIPICICVLTQIAPGHRRKASSLPNMLTRIIATASRFSRACKTRDDSRAFARETGIAIAG